MKAFMPEEMDLKSMSAVLGGNASNVSLDIKTLWTRKTRQSHAVSDSENEQTEITGTISVDREK